MRGKPFDGDWEKLKGAECVCPTCNRLFSALKSFDAHMTWLGDTDPGSKCANEPPEQGFSDPDGSFKGVSQ